MTATEFKKLIEDNFRYELYDFASEDYTKDNKTYEEFLKQNDIVFIENNDIETYNSYGQEDSILERIFLHVPTGKYFMMYGTRQSYNGTEWDGIREVQKVEKTITVWQ